MSRHLSDDQITGCIVGTASSEEEQHGHSCVRCRDRIHQFTDAVCALQGVMKGWSDGESFPRLQETVGERHGWGWIAAGVAVAVLAAVPLPQRPEPQQRQASPEPEHKSDEMLMEEVAAHLSRPLPMSMERVMVLLPDVAQGGSPEREEVR
jgi:hypothetical protein